LNVFRTYSKALLAQGVSSNRISSGLQISSAKDNPMGLSASEKMNMQIRGLQMAGANLQDGVSMLQTNDGGLNEITSTLQRIRDLTVEAGNDTATPTDKNTIQNEIDAMIKTVDQLSAGTTFNGVNLINDKSGIPVSMATGSNPNETIDIPTYNISSNSIGADGSYLSTIDVTTSTGVKSALKVIDGAISTVSTIRSKFGALSNRFESSQFSTTELADKLTDSYSNVKDSDISSEMVQFTKNGIITDAATAILAQTNKFPQEILKVLQNVR
jgi:flagellin